MSNYHDPFDWLTPKPEPRNALLDFIESKQRPTLANALCPPHRTTGTMFGSLAPHRPKTVWVGGHFWRNPYYPYNEVWIEGHWRAQP